VRTKGLEGVSVETVDIWLEDNNGGTGTQAGTTMKGKKKGKKKGKSRRVHTSTGPLLFTHEGLSGPAVLTLSAFAALDFHSAGYKTRVGIDWTAGEWTAQEISDALRAQKQAHPRQKVGSGCPLGVSPLDRLDRGGKPIKPMIPKRLWRRIVMAATATKETKLMPSSTTSGNTAGTPSNTAGTSSNTAGTPSKGDGGSRSSCTGCVDRVWAATTKLELEAIGRELREFMVETTGKTRYKDEFVTAGKGYCTCSSLLLLLLLYPPLHTPSSTPPPPPHCTW
jgi:hypothetical protein